MRISLLALGAGFLFAMGLGISGMSNPDKVLGFLDVAGNWDPSLLFVMVGAISVNIFLFRFILRRKTPLLGDKWYVPRIMPIERRLILGSLIFGIGWGLVGLCPGPAITDLGSGKAEIFLFVIAMAGGMIVHKVIHGSRVQATTVGPSKP